MNGSNGILSERMVQLRGKRSQGEAARLLGITQAYLSEIERGKKMPSYLVLITIAAAYETSVAYHLGEVESSEALTPSYRVSSDGPLGVPAPNRAVKRRLVSPSNPALPVYTTDKLLAQLRCDGLSAPFAVIADSAALASFGIPIGAEVVIDPSAPVNELDVGLMHYKNAFAIAKYRRRRDGSTELLTSDGTRHRIYAEDQACGDFAVIGKVITVTYRMSHGL